MDVTVSAWSKDYAPGLQRIRAALAYGTDCSGGAGISTAVGRWEGPGMNSNCAKCGMQLEVAWEFCPQCGATHERHAAETPEPEHHPARGAFGGLAYGLIAAPILIVTGIMICLTGWGILLGLPVIVAGILAPLAGPLLGMSEHAAKCPVCGTHMVTVADGKVHHCPVCSEKFAVGEHGVIAAH